MGKRILVAEFRLDKFKDRPEEAPLTKRQEQERFKKYGRLTVLRLHLKKKGQAQQVDCLCECGRIITKAWYDVKQGKEPRNCGNPDCLWSRIDALLRLRQLSCGLNQNGVVADLTQAVREVNCAASAARSVTGKAVARWLAGIILRLVVAAREGRGHIEIRRFFCWHRRYTQLYKCSRCKTVIRDEYSWYKFCPACGREIERWE